MALNFGNNLFTEDPQFTEEGRMWMEGTKDAAAKEKAQISAIGFQTGAGTTTIYTVPANKVFYFTYFAMSCYKTAAAEATFYLINEAGNVAVWYLPAVPNDNQMNLSTPFTMPVKFVAGDRVRINSSHATGKMVCSIMGWLEDA